MGHLPGYQRGVSSRPVSDAFRRQAEALRAGADVSLGETALSIAEDLADDVDADAARLELDRLGRLASEALAEQDSARDRSERLLQLLRAEGFRGNTDAYHDPRNSYLDQVLRRRTGIPITLSIVVIEIAARAGLRLSGVSFPAHFLVRSSDDPPVILDAFHGELLSLSDCRDRLRAAAGPRAVFDPTMLRAATPREVMARMLGNLKNTFVQAGNWIRAIDCSDRILLVAPELLGERRDRGLLWAQLGFTGPAIEDLEAFLEAAPDAPEADKLRAHLSQLHARDVTVH